MIKHTHITVAGKPLGLNRPVADFVARRLERVVPQLNALNDAGKSQADAAEALGISVGSLRTWLGLTGIEWTNVTRRGPYRR